MQTEAASATIDKRVRCEVLIRVFDVNLAALWLTWDSAAFYGFRSVGFQCKYLVTIIVERMAKRYHAANLREIACFA